MKQINFILFFACIAITFLVPNTAKAQTASEEQIKTVEKMVSDIGHCVAIITSFERLECYDEVVERYNITETTNLQDIETPLDIGKWRIKEEVSDIDGQHIIYMSLAPENDITVGYKKNLSPNLVVRCITNTEDYNGSVYIIWDFPISKKNSIYIKRRFERETPVGSHWTVSNDRKGTFYDKPLYLIQEFLKYNSFRIETTYQNNPLTTLVYNLRGFDNVVRTVKDRCGWN